ncbi:MAG: hypothetical protein ACOX1S_03830 [Anaerostipes sp.]|jgi:hypothetical protein
MKYVLRAGYPKVLLSIFIGELSTSLVVVVVYLGIQKQFYHNFDSTMKLFSLPGMLLSTIIIVCLILLTVKFLYKPLGRFADMKVPVPFLFVLIFAIDYVAGAFTYIDFSWKSSIFLSSSYSVIGLGILYLVNEWTRRKAEKEILLEYEALKQEKEAMENFENTLIVQEQKREELQKKIEEQVKMMERYMKNNPSHHEVEGYVEELRKMYRDK